MKIIYAITIGVMFLLAAEDARTKEMDWCMAGGGMIGLCMIGISFLSKEQIGIGDGVVTGLLGCLLGARGCLVMLCIASCLMAVIAIGILILKKCSRRTTLPFAPALLGGYIAALAVLG